MQQFKRVIEKEISEISRLATRVRNLLKDTAPVPAPVQYRMVMRSLAELNERWTDHLEFHSRVTPNVLSVDPRLSAAMRCLDSDGLDIQHKLHLLASADWPRSAHAGLISIRARIFDVLAALLKHLRDERETILPLLRFWTPTKVVAVAPPLARAQFIETSVSS